MIGRMSRMDYEAGELQTLKPIEKRDDFPILVVSLRCLLCGTVDDDVIYVIGEQRQVYNII